MRTKHNRIRLIRGNTGIVSKWNSDSVSLEWKIIKFMARISSVSSLSSTDFFFKVWYLQLLASARKRLSALAYVYSFICSLVFGEGNGNPLQYSCLKNPMERGAWWATVQKVAELDMTEQLTHTHTTQLGPASLWHPRSQRHQDTQWHFSRIKLNVWRRKWPPTPVFLPGESHGPGSLVGYSHGVTEGQTRLSD